MVIKVKLERNLHMLVDFFEPKMGLYDKYVLLIDFSRLVWTVELLKTKTMSAGMRANWYGLLGKKIKDTFGHILT